MILRKIPHFIEIERNSRADAWGIKSSLNSSTRCAPVTGVENPFLRGMQPSEPSFILTSTEDDQRVTNRSFSESVEASIGGSVFRDDPLGLSFVFPHRPSNNTARTKILDRTPCRNCQQLDRLCDWIANVTAWLYSGEPVLHLRIRVQHAAVAQGTNTHICNKDQTSGVTPCVLT
jgi:hypothetical protein